MSAAYRKLCTSHVMDSHNRFRKERFTARLLKTDHFVVNTPAITEVNGRVCRDHYGRTFPCGGNKSQLYMWQFDTLQYQKVDFISTDRGTTNIQNGCFTRSLATIP